MTIFARICKALLLLLAISPASVFCVPSAPAAPRPAARPIPVSNPYHLTPAEQARWRVLRTAFDANARRVLSDKTLPPARRSAELAQLRAQNKQKMLAVLTPSQRQAVLNGMAEQAALGVRLREVSTLQVKIFTAYTKFLKSLKPAQGTKMTAIRPTFMAERIALINNRHLTPSQRSLKFNHYESHLLPRLKSILSPRQFADYRNLLNMQQSQFSLAPSW